jgi:uncharacterized protein YkwD
MIGCGGDSGGDGQQAAAGGEIGDARIATNDSADQVGKESSGSDGGVAQGEPSLDQLDDSGPAPEALGAPGAGCSGGGLTPRRANLAQVQLATICLINVERHSRGQPSLRASGQLARAAADHAQNMVTKSYFAHDSLDGGTFIDRIRARGYLTGRRGWTVGENLAWAGGYYGRPREVVSLWMHSPPHRANILNRRFRDVGIAVALGAPVRRAIAGGAATYGSEFGVRARR